MRAFRLPQQQPARAFWRAYLNNMPKRIHIITLALLSILFVGCHHKKETQEVHPMLPSLHITMTPTQLDSILIDVDNKVSVFAVLTDAQGDTLYEGRLAHIKTRGNTTWNERKKPFAIKFQEKHSLFGLSRSKSFVLLANAFDESHIRNAIALDLARAMGIPATHYAYLTLYINDVYRGLYQMTNKVDVGKNALNITDLEKLNERANPKPLEEYEWCGLGRKKQLIQRKGVLLDNDPEDITGGYLLDNSCLQASYDKSISGFVSEAGDNIKIRSPQHASLREVDYIARLYNEMECAIIASDGIHPETGKHYSEYIDVESFARYYILNELLLNYDGGWSSFMMYKEMDDIDPKFHAGPAWDYDRILDNPQFQSNSYAFPNEFYIDNELGKTGIAHSGGLLYHLCQHDDFQQLVKDCYLNDISPVCHDYLESRPFDSLVAMLSHEADQDNAKYEKRISEDYLSAAHRATDFLSSRIDFFDRFYSTKDEGYVLVSMKWHNKKYLKFYFLLGEPVYAPQVTKVVNNHDPNYALYYPDTDSLVADGTVFYSPQKLELRQCEPTKREVQIRRVKKKLRKIGLDF